VPKLVAAAVVALIILGWLVFFLVGALATIDAHFTNRPQDFPEFQLTRWQPAAAGGGAGRITRDAVWPLRFRTLRYRQVSDDGGVTVETVRYAAEIRWGRTGAAMVGSGLLPVVAYFGLRRVVARGGDSAR
jgi:hypothetical protein